MMTTHLSGASPKSLFSVIKIFQRMTISPRSSEQVAPNNLCNSFLHKQARIGGKENNAFSAKLNSLYAGNGSRLIREDLASAMIDPRSISRTNVGGRLSRGGPRDRRVRRA
ncbi:hypothetical protein HRR95_006836 [Exophiala dermatitidis]|nr:hypothetical protein HRR95_006836 [Exophiala dermatitidis]